LEFCREGDARLCPTYNILYLIGVLDAAEYTHEDLNPTISYDETGVTMKQ